MHTKLRTRKIIFQKGAHSIKSKKNSTKRLSQQLRLYYKKYDKVIHLRRVQTTFNDSLNCYHVIFIRFYVQVISFFKKYSLSSNLFSPELGAHLN